LGDNSYDPTESDHPVVSEFHAHASKSLKKQAFTFNDLVTILIEALLQGKRQAGQVFDQDESV
jgi:hypothetical protein